MDVEEEKREERSIIDFSDELRVRASLYEMEARLSVGFDDEQTRYEMGLPASDYDRLKRIFYDRETSKLKKSTAHEVFIDFAIGQKTVLRNVDVLMEEMKESKQFSAAVGALRLASDIKKRVIDGTASHARAEEMARRVPMLASAAWSFAKKAGATS